MPSPAESWDLVDFLDRFDRWTEIEQPTEDLRYVVLEWIHSRATNPYQDVQRANEFPNLWFGQVPNSHDGRGCVVVCSYWISESDRRVRCDQLSTLSTPI